MRIIHLPRAPTNCTPSWPGPSASVIWSCGPTVTSRLIWIRKPASAQEITARRRNGFLTQDPDLFSALLLRKAEKRPRSSKLGPYRRKSGRRVHKEVELARQSLERVLNKNLRRRGNAIGPLRYTKLEH